MGQIDRSEGLVGNTGIKAPCVVTTSSNITLIGEQTIDGVTTSASRVLVRAQTNSSENGIYVSDSGSWQRADDFDGSYDIVQGTLVTVTQGSLYGGSIWWVTTANPIVIGATGISFAKFIVGPSDTISYQSTAVGAVLRTLNEKLGDDDAYLEDFGGSVASSNNTAAFTLAQAYMEATGENVKLRVGTYLTDPFVMDSQFYSLQSGFIGKSKRKTIIKRRVGGSGIFVQVGDPSSTVFAASPFYFKELTIDGGATTNGDAFAGYDLVRTNFENVRFQGGAIPVHMYGGISVTFTNPTMDLGVVGFKAEKFTSLAGGGYPNLIRILGGEIVDNTSRGVEFDYGQQLIIEHCDIEGNGTTLGNSAHGGIWIGPNIGENVFASDNLVPGLIGTGLWIEQNKGRDAVTFEYGINSLTGCEFFQQSTQVTNDINVIGGRYHLDNVNIGFAKTYNLLEGAGVVAGNTIRGLDSGSNSINSLKTAIWNGERFYVRNGELPSLLGINKPIIQQGIEAASATPTITFGTAFKSGTTPYVFCQASDNTATNVHGPTVHTVSHTGFTIRKKTWNGAAVSDLNYGVYWVAIGESD